MKQALKWLGILLAITLIVACSKVSPDTFAKVENGMTEEQVKGLIGSPNELNSGGIGPLSSTTYKYKSGDQEYIVNFMNGKVVMKVQQPAK